MINPEQHPQQEDHIHGTYILCFSVRIDFLRRLSSFFGLVPTMWEIPLPAANIVVKVKTIEIFQMRTCPFYEAQNYCSPASSIVIVTFTMYIYPINCIFFEFLFCDTFQRYFWLDVFGINLFLWFVHHLGFLPTMFSTFWGLFLLYPFVELLSST